MDETNALPADPNCEAQIDEVIAEFGGDARAAIAALLHDLEVLAADYEATVSKGFVRAAASSDTPRKRSQRQAT